MTDRGYDQRPHDAPHGRLPIAEGVPVLRVECQWDARTQAAAGVDVDGFTRFWRVREQLLGEDLGGGPRAGAWVSAR